MTRTQPAARIPARRRHPADNGNPCRQGHELFRPNLRDIDFVISPSIMINAIFLRFMAALYNLFNIFLCFVCVNLKNSNPATPCVRAFESFPIAGASS